jgi:formiminotetrahydrofolate cyclodeaminase
MYLKKAMKEYLDDLAARKPAPGGGSAAALAASTGAALMCMVANYTAGNPKYKNAEEKIADIRLKLEGFRQRLQDLIDEDVEAYTKLSKGIKDCAKDAGKLDELYKEAAGVPFEVCRICADCLNLCSELAVCGNKNLITDTAIAAIMLEGAFFSARFNVYVNLKYVKDLEFIGRLHRYLSPLEEGLPKLKEEILEKCEEVIEK